MSAPVIKDSISLFGEAETVNYLNHKISPFEIFLRAAGCSKRKIAERGSGSVSQQLHLLQIRAIRPVRGTEREPFDRTDHPQRNQFAATAVQGTVDRLDSLLGQSDRRTAQPDTLAMGSLLQQHDRVPNPG